MKSYQPSESPSEYKRDRQLSPQKQQWALINQYKALQYQRLKQKERLLAQQKKMNFRRQLDNQLNSKNNVHQQQVESDRKYYDFITQQANQHKQKQERQKIDKIIRRKHIQTQNSKKLQMTMNSRAKDYDTGYHLDIGHRSQEQRKRNTQNIKKQVLDTLDQQLRQKYQSKQVSKYKQMQNYLKNVEYQNSYFSNRQNNNKHFQQNERVYQYYMQLERQKRMKDAQLEYRFVDEAAEKKKMLDDERIRNEQAKKYHIKQQVKETLDRQVRAHNMRRFEESKINPQDFSYEVIGNVFRERHSSFDKNKYVEELRAQAEQQKRRKKMENFMSQEEYRINLNQLNKVVNGQYAHNQYLDRSMGTIGDSKQLRLTDIKDSIRNPDAQLVKFKLDTLKSRNNNSQVISKTDRSF